MKAVFFSLALLGLAHGAEASLKICNPHDSERSVAIGHRDGPDWVSEGWWNIDPGDCATVLGGDLKRRYYHYFENQPGFTGDPASRELCVELSKFSVTGQDNCQAGVQKTVRFKRIDVGGKATDYTFDLPAPVIERSMERSVFWYGSVAEEPPRWGNAGNWAVHVANTLDGTSGCFAYKTYPDGTVFRVGIDPWRPERYLFAFGNDQWQSLEYDQEYELEVQLTGQAKWTIGTTGRNPADGWPVFLTHRSSGNKFVDDFMRGNAMNISYNGSRIASLSLSGTTNALSQIRACQAELERDQGRPKGGGGQKNPNDPFAK